MINDNNEPSDAMNEQQEDLDTLQAKIADQVAELSLAEEVPTGYSSLRNPFEASDVDFGSNMWLLRMLQIQAWLNPAAEIDMRKAESDPRSVAVSFFVVIGARNPPECVDCGAEVVRLTLAGAEYLAARLDAAIQFQREFQEARENSTRKQATENWTVAWDETESELQSSEPIKAKTDIWRISDFSARAKKGLLNLSPSYQRGDVWPTRDSQKLIESILRGIPLPSIILLKQAGGTRQAPYEVVDGKQRLTAILRFMGQHPQAIERVTKAHKQNPEAKLLQLFQSDYKKFRRTWKNVRGESLSDRLEAEYYFPFRLARGSEALGGPLAVTAGKYYCDIADEQINVGEGPESVQDVFEKSSEYKIPLIEYLDATPRQIHEVFHLYNRQGKHLNAEEIRNALFHDVDLVRLVLVASGDNQHFAALAKYFPKTKYQLLQDIAECLSDYRFGKARYRRTKILSWLYALLFQQSESDGELKIRSTAKHTDALFESIQGAARRHEQHRLAEQTVLVQLIEDTSVCLYAHSSADCWDPRFKNDDKGQTWQELQLVGSVLGVFLLVAAGENATAILTQCRDQLLAFTASHPRPKKTQNKNQWAFVGEVSLGILRIAAVDESRLTQALISKYGVSCLPTLRAARALYEPERA